MSVSADIMTAENKTEIMMAGMLRVIGTTRLEIGMIENVNRNVMMTPPTTMVAAVRETTTYNETTMILYMQINMNKFINWFK